MVPVTSIQKWDTGYRYRFSWGGVLNFESWYPIWILRNINFRPCYRDYLLYVITHLGGAMQLYPSFCVSFVFQLPLSFPIGLETD